MTTRSDILLDGGENKIVAVTTQDVEPIIDANKRLQGISQKSDWGQHYARIPNVTLTEWLYDEWKRGNTLIQWGSKEFDELIERKLRDPDWKHLLVYTPTTNFTMGWR